MFRRKKECKRCHELECDIARMQREKEFALECRDKLHRKELVYLMSEIAALRLINEKLMNKGR